VEELVEQMKRILPAIKIELREKRKFTALEEVDILNNILIEIAIWEEKASH